jgi:DNA-binding GntR family transcriptional regulator
MSPPGPELPSARVAREITARCEAGEWAPGERMPSVSRLAKEYGVAPATVVKALRILTDQGIVTVVPNWGTFKT